MGVVVGTSLFAEIVVTCAISAVIVIVLVLIAGNSMWSTVAWEPHWRSMGLHPAATFLMPLDRWCWGEQVEVVGLPPAISFVFCEKSCTRLVLGERMRSARLWECTYRALRFSTLSYKDITFATIAPSSCCKCQNWNTKLRHQTHPKFVILGP